MNALMRTFATALAFTCVAALPVAAIADSAGVQTMESQAALFPNGFCPGSDPAAPCQRIAWRTMR